MNESAGYAVFFFPPALEALGDAIKPYLQDGPAGPHVPCRDIDTGGAFIEMTLQGQSPDGRVVELELMVPGNMVRMIVSAHSDNEFGFYDRNRAQAMLEPGMPVIAPADATPAAEPPAVQAPIPATAV
ncbi:hypothetical protein [Thermomonas carbonis]|uniref:Uncharacterized protein n=1 Tax=Thermomonas carbonis TaxID=1463158 RepID=A0A7G9SQY0_9GAMM|nr:hypothetical protein [Thermomonas carbonis]QNN70255.1 hypothetical protein H9L16_00990 [Thermomonas carbonis]GHB98776.1 hypothetical protein GCM10010080_09190 [Thermomonas carbonis]